MAGKQEIKTRKIVGKRGKQCRGKERQENEGKKG